MIPAERARTLDEIEIILNLCLELVQRGFGQVDALVDRYPDMKDILKPPLEAATWLLLNQTSFDPLPDYRLHAKSRILCYIRNPRGREILSGEDRRRFRNAPIIVLN
jgi:hypothetical protein